MWPKRFVMPTTDLGDGELRVSRLDDDRLLICVGEQQPIAVSEFTAAQLIGTLSLFLNVRPDDPHE